jgi:zinc transporter ZupT
MIHDADAENDCIVPCAVATQSKDGMKRRTMMLPRKRSQSALTCVVVTMIMNRSGDYSNVAEGYISDSGSGSSSSGSSTTQRRRSASWSTSTDRSRSTAATAASSATTMIRRSNNRHSTTTVVVLGAVHHDDDSHLSYQTSPLPTTISLHAGGSANRIDRRQAFSRLLAAAVMGTSAVFSNVNNPSPPPASAIELDHHEEARTSDASAARFLSTESAMSTTTTSESLTRAAQDMRQIKTKTSHEKTANTSDYEPFDWTASPLTLSLLAGLSTCLGAAVVFCARGGGSNDNTDGTGTATSKTKSPLTDAHMAFSLSLAGSVMVTVSVVSILPESFQDESYVDGFRFLSFGSVLFLQRCFSFLVGCALYALLSKCAFPEPDAILGLDGSGRGSIDHDNDARTNDDINNSEHHGQLLQASTSFGSHHDESTTALLITASGSQQHSSVLPSNRSNKKYNGGGDFSPFSTPSRKAVIKNIQQQQHQPYLRLIRPQQSSSVDDEEDDDNRTTNGSSPSRTPSRRKPSIKSSQQIPYLRNTRPQQQSSSMGDEDISEPAPLVQSSSQLLLQEEDADEEARGYTNKKGNKILLDARLSTWTRLSRYSSGADLQTDDARRAWRVAMLLFISLAIHNFPEGLAVAVSSMHSQRLGVTTTIAIALHNIPEGIAIAVPCLAARPESPWLAFGLASLSGLAEPLGAFVAMCFLQGSNGEEPAIVSMNDILAFVAGIMIMVAVSELFPEACRHSKERRLPFILGLVLGAVVMVSTELILS